MSLTLRIKKRARRMLEQLVPYRSRYRPKAAYPSAAAYLEANPHSGVQVCEIFNYHFELPVPADLFAQLSPYFSYDAVANPDSDMPTFVSDYRHAIAVLPGGRLLTNNTDMVAAITADDFLLGDVSYQYHPNRPLQAQENLAMRLRYFKEPTHLPGTLFSLLAGGGATFNYGHWVIDALPRLHLLKLSGYFDEVDHFLVPTFKHDYHRDTLRLLGVPEDKIIVATDDMHLAPQRLIASTHPRGNRSYLVPGWVIDFHRQNFLSPDRADGRFSELVYVSRKDSSIRNVVNEEEVMALLGPLGFKEYILAELPFQDKIELFAQAKVIISASGAGLNNLMYSKPGCSFLEIFPQGLVHTQYYNMAHYLGMDYSYMICRGDQHATSMRDGLKEHIYVDVAELQSKVLRMLRVPVR